MTGHF